MTVGERIKALRKERGLSQNKLAKLAGIAQPTLSAIENTTKSPNIVTVGLIAAAHAARIARVIRISVLSRGKYP